jgi:hypothetical protein
MEQKKTKKSEYVWVCVDTSNSNRPGQYIWVHKTETSAWKQKKEHDDSDLSMLSVPKKWDKKKLEDYIVITKNYYQKVGRCESCGEKSKDIDYENLTLTVFKKTYSWFGLCEKCVKNIASVLLKSDALKGLKIGFDD